MGLFSGTTKTFISSTAFNMAGDDKQQLNLLGSTILGGVLSGDKSLGSTINTALMNGPANDLKRFYRYGSANYPEMLSDAEVTKELALSTQEVGDILAPLLGLASNESLHVGSAVIDGPEVQYFVEQWLLENTSETLNEEDWSVDFDYDTEEFIVIYGTAGNVTTARFPADPDFLWAYENNEKLLYASYTVLSVDDIGLVTESLPELYVYRMGSGNVDFDALAQQESVQAEFFPIIPIRLNTRRLSETYAPELYEKSKSLFKKLTGGKIDTLLDQIEENPDKGDIDHGFIVQGIPLNTEEQAGKEYIYNFFKELAEQEPGSKDDFLAEVERLEEYKREYDRLRARLDKGTDERWLAYRADTFAIQALIRTSGQFPQRQFRYEAAGVPKFLYTFRWNFIKETQHTGNAKKEQTAQFHTFGDDPSLRDPAKVGEYWFKAGPGYSYREHFKPLQYQNLSEKDEIHDRTRRVWEWRYAKVDQVLMYHQHSPFQYSRIELVGFGQSNHIKGKTESLSGTESLTEATESGLIIPLHYPTWKGMGLSKMNQLTTSCSYIVFNSYEKQTTSFWQSGFFKILLVIAIATISVIIPGLGGMAGSGILGSNIAVGTALGATTAMGAAIAGAIANQLTLMLLTTVVQLGADAVFGKKIGAIIGTVASFVAMTYAANYAQTGTFNVDWGNMMRIENLMKLTDSVSTAYSRYMAADTMEIQEEIREGAEEHEEDLERIQDMANEILGQTGVYLDVSLLMDSANSYTESEETFLQRTLLTGSDLAELTHTMISEFSEISRDLPKAFA